MRFTQSILFKIGAVIFTVETLVFAVLSVHYIKRIHGYIDKQIDERISIPGRMISNGTLNIRVATHPGTIETLIGPHFVELMQVWIVDSTGKIVQALDPIRIGDPITEIQDLGRAWTGYRAHQNSLRTIHSPKNHAVICITPLDSTNQTRPARHLFIQVNTERAEKIKTRVVLLAAIGSWIGVLLPSMAMILIFKYLISRRIHSIVSVLRHVEQGDWNARFDGKILKDEIGIIETHVNSMVIQLRETIQTLENRLFDLKESEKERERIQIQFYQAQKMEALGVLTSGVAYDFNNLLTAIQGCTDLALVHTQKSDAVHSDLMEIQLAAKRASDLTHQLLLFSRKQPLKRNGYEVHTATTISEALDLFERNKRNFQLVFSDVVLPDRSGVELVEDLLEKKPDLAVLLSSGYTDLKSQWDIILKKNYHFLQKLYRLNFLLKTIREVLVLRKD